ncbi:MAG: metal-dependent hydrolase [Cyanobacteria bacterium P01_G01_bin.54]
MSSFVGHSLAAWTIHQLKPGLPSAKSKHAKRDRPIRNFLRSWLWLVWLTVIALVPDCDNALSWVHPSAHEGLRITHSLGFALILPLLTILGLWWRQRPGLGVASLQLVGAGLSHLLLDLLVGVTALPLLWPLNPTAFKLPFGLLPSAGKLSLSNFYLYYNLAIELGVLLPLSIGVLLGCRLRKHRWLLGFLLVILGLISGRFMVVAYNLSR